MLTRLLVLALCSVLCSLMSCSGNSPTNGGSTSDIPQNIFAGEPFAPNDPLFFYNPDNPLYPGQWNIYNQAPNSIYYPATVAPNGHQTAEVAISNIGLDANILPVWRAGYTGRGIIIGILDDGVEFGHPDLNIVTELSTGMDYKGIVPGQTGAHRKDSDSHGTTVAGIAAAVGGNGIGVCGLAPHARIASVAVNNFTTFESYFMHAPAVYWQAGLGWMDQMNSTALAKLTAINSAPIIQLKNSSSKTAQFSYLDGFADTYSAFARTAANGMLFIQAAGNCRATEQQDANISMEATCPYVIDVAALGSNGHYALYSNFGAAVFVTTLSESAWWNVTNSKTAAYANGLGVSSTDRFSTRGTNYDNNGSSVFLPDIANLDYTAQFDGTSAAAPSLTGMLAVAKQANPNLNSRMAKHLLARTSRLVDPDDKSSSATWMGNDGRIYSGWQTNSAGFRLNPNYGFGLPDVAALVKALLQTAYVTDETIYHTGLRTVPAQAQTINGGDSVGSTQTISITVPDGIKQSLEGVEVYLNVTGSDRRDIQIVVSKGGISSRLLAPASGLGKSGSPMFDDDKSADGINHFFLSNAFWGENPNGTWSVTVSSPTGTSAANWLNWGIVLHMGELAFEGAGDKQVTSDRTILGLSLNRPGTQMLIPSLQTVNCAGDVQLNNGKLTIMGTLLHGSNITVTRLDTSFSAVTETLSYNRGMHTEIAGGLLTGSGSLIAPGGTDNRGGVFNSRGTVRPGQENIAGTLSFGSASEPTNYTQGSKGALTIDALDLQNYGRLAVNGTVKLSGTLTVITGSEANMQKGTRLNNVISATSLSGSFDIITATIPGTQGLHWQPVYGATGLDLVAAVD
ncbi:MAG: hypothetical protein CSYNP_00797 [Syntrophus sp. SKADARSKE-3]|nr:hypothetical protein [Syntrophus sp. SKADARSKE-3]